MSEKLFIPLLLGTNRQDNQSQKAAKFLLEQLVGYPELEGQLFLAKDFALPADNYGQKIKNLFPAWQEAIIRADGLIIVTPEYNHGYPGILKSILDLLLPEYKHKPVGLAMVSDGMFGGVRGAENLLPVFRELGLIVSANTLYFPQVPDFFDEQNRPLDEKVNQRVAKFLAEFSWLAKTLKYGRENY